MKYVPYQPFTQKAGHQSANRIPENMSHAQQIGFGKLAQFLKGETGNTDAADFLTKQLGFKQQEDLFAVLTPEQCDSILMAIYNSAKGSECIVGDETGIGKGRILAGIARYALQHNKNVLFFTENTSLFSAFWGDIKDVGVDSLLGDNEVFILHGGSDGVIFDNGEVVHRCPKAEKMKTLIANGEFEHSPRLMMTTYSQFSRITSGEKKIGLIERFFMDSKSQPIVIFDEFHNSTGNSTTREFKDKIVSLGASCVYSSATFLDKNKQLASFMHLLDMKPTLENERVMLALDNVANPILDNQIAFFLAKEMRLLRREHGAVEKMNYIQIDDEDEEELAKFVAPYRAILHGMFDCYLNIEQIVKKDPSFVQQIVTERLNKKKMRVDGKEMKKLIDKELKNWKNKWTTFGSVINRMTQTLMLACMVTPLEKRIHKHLAENRKCVVILESTFDALINTCIDYHEMGGDKLNVKVSETYHGLNFKTLLHNLLKNILEEYSYCSTAMREQYLALQAEIDEFPLLELNFIDAVHERLAQAGIKSLEISGRSHKVVKTGDDVYRFQSITDKKPLVKDQFNNDPEAQVIILTRAGSTGISLHASETFKDQRQRVMIEVEISRRVKTRKQFYGRISRYKEVVKGLYENLHTSMPFQKRVIALEELKMQKMRAMVGSDYTVESLDYDYYNPTVNDMVKDFLTVNKELARKLGIYMQSQEPLYFIDTLLKRSILLQQDEQDVVLDFLDAGAQVYVQMKEAHDAVLNSFTRNIMVGHMHTAFEKMNNTQKNQFAAYKRPQRLVCDYPVVQLVNVHNEIQIQDSEFPNREFDVEQYRHCLANVYINPYFHKDTKAVLNANLHKMALLDKDVQLSFMLNGNMYYGKVEHIDFSEKYKQYPTHYCYHIRLISPEHLKENNRILCDKIVVSGKVLLQNANFTVSDKPADEEKYRLPEHPVKQEMQFLVGNMFYLTFFSQLLGTGEIISFDKALPANNGDTNTYQILAVRLPNRFVFNDQTVRPILNPYEMYGALAGYGLKTFDDSITIQKMNTVDIRYEITIDKGAYFDNRIVDFKTYERLGGYKKDLGNAFVFELDYNDVKSLVMKFFHNPLLVFHELMM